MAKHFKKAKDKIMPMIEKPKIILDRMIYHKIMHWVDKSSDEVSGLGTVVQQEDGSFKVIEVMLLPQKNTSGTTDIEAEDVAKAMYELREAEGSLNFWWHSHVNMAVFWSGTDRSTIEEFGNAGGQGGFVVATVFNKKYEMRSAVYVNSPVNGGMKIFMDEVDTRIVTFLDTELVAAWDAEYEKNVKPRTHSLPSTTVYRPGEATSRDKLLGFTSTWENNKYQKIAINKLGLKISGAEPILFTEKFPLDVIQKIQESNERIAVKAPEFVLRLLDDEELYYAVSIKSITEQEYMSEMVRRETDEDYLGRSNYGDDIDPNQWGMM